MKDHSKRFLKICFYTICLIASSILSKIVLEIHFENAKYLFYVLWILIAGGFVYELSLFLKSNQTE
jgi:hypothetical protein